MYIHMIVVQYEEDTFEIHDAWDEWTVEDNPDGFKEKLEAANKKFQGRVREVLVEVPDDFFKRAFQPVKMKGKPVSDE